MAPADRPLTPTELAAFRARQKSRSRALALVLLALVVLFFAITIVKLREESKRDAKSRQQLATPIGVPHGGTSTAGPQ
ncbi:hypothetical protein [Novosphingobium sp.]|uniref:hypothetical protein n=1 Tax=Novosphingobium sp. TaxID=1874826 RepID=UPI003B5162A0